MTPGRARPTQNCRYARLTESGHAGDAVAGVPIAAADDTWQVRRAARPADDGRTEQRSRTSSPNGGLASRPAAPERHGGLAGTSGLGARERADGAHPNGRDVTGRVTQHSGWGSESLAPSDRAVLARWSRLRRLRRAAVAGSRPPGPERRPCGRRPRSWRDRRGRDRRCRRR